MRAYEQTAESCPGAPAPDAGYGLLSSATLDANHAHNSDSDLLAALLETLADRIYFKDSECRFVRCSREQARIAGCDDPADLIGKNDHDIFSSEHADQALADEQHILQTGQPVIGKVEKETWPDGRVGWVLTTKVARRDKEGRIIGTLGISKDISELKAAEARLQDLDRRLLESSRLASMAEVATGVLHNVGNVLNSVNVSATLVADGIKRSRLGNLAKAIALLQEQNGNLADYLTSDPKGKLLPEYLANLSEHLAAEQDTLRRELASLTEYIGHIKEIVAMQQSYARVAGTIEALPPADLVEDAVRVNFAAYVRHRIEVVRDFQPTPHVRVDKHKSLQILVNLLSNAKYALDGARACDKRVRLSIQPWGTDRVRITVSDNGSGIAPEHLARIFDHGFTTREDGHGFGLHSSANAAREMGATLSVLSDGPGQGAAFTLELPIAPPAPSTVPTALT